MRRQGRFFVCMLLFCVLLTACSAPIPLKELVTTATEPPLEGAMQAQVQLSFVAENADKTGELMKTEQRTVYYSETTSLDRAVLDALIAGPTQQGAVNVMPSSLSVLQLQREGTQLLITLSLGDAPQEDVDLQLIKTTIAMTFLSMEGTEQVGVYTDSVKYDEAGAPTDLFDQSLLVSGDAISEGSDLVVTLYFPDAASGSLIEEARSLKTTSGEQTEEAVVRELLKGPTGGWGTSGKPFLSDVQLLSAFVDEGVCYLDFSKELFAPEASEALMLLSFEALASSLKANSDCEAIEILVSGAAWLPYQRVGTQNTLLPEN